MKPAMKKGILKNKGEVISPAPSMMPTGEKPGAHLKWDEETIAAQDKERGGKMKITEPKTPYNYYDSDEDEEEKAQQVTEANTMMNKVISKLEQHQMTGKSSEGSPMREYEYEEEEEEDKLTEEERRKKELFKKKQKMHYKGEYAKAKMLLRKYHPEDEA